MVSPPHKRPISRCPDGRRRKQVGAHAGRIDHVGIAAQRSGHTLLSGPGRLPRCLASCTLGQPRSDARGEGKSRKPKKPAYPTAPERHPHAGTTCLHPVLALVGGCPGQKLSVSEDTTQCWKRRTTVEDRPTRPIASTTLSPEQEAIVLALRKTLRLPLDDLLVVTREFISTVWLP